MHRHQEIALADIANPRPLGVPAMCAIVAVAGLREAVGLPCAVLPTHQDQGAVVPPNTPDGVIWRLIPGDAPRCGDFSELVATDDGPAGAIPFGEAATRNGWVFQREVAMLAIVCVDKHALGGCEAFAVIAREVCFSASGKLLIAVELLGCKGADIDFVESFFHGHHVDVGFWML